jgi:hypothetical protein
MLSGAAPRNTARSRHVINPHSGETVARRSGNDGLRNVLEGEEMLTKGMVALWRVAGGTRTFVKGIAIARCERLSLQLPTNQG